MQNFSEIYSKTTFASEILIKKDSTKPIPVYFIEIILILKQIICLRNIKHKLELKKFEQAIIYRGTNVPYLDINDYIIKIA